MKQYIITVKGKKYRYASLEAAEAAASEIFKKLNIVVGIEQYLLSNR